MTIEVKDKPEADQLYGRMMEDIEILNAIKSGQFQNLDDVKKALSCRAENINTALSDFGLFEGVSSVSKDEFEIIAASYDAALPTTVKH
jgi:hypothetical protein